MADSISYQPCPSEPATTYTTEKSLLIETEPHVRRQISATNDLTHIPAYPRRPVFANEATARCTREHTKAVLPSKHSNFLRSAFYPAGKSPSVNRHVEESANTLIPLDIGRNEHSNHLGHVSSGIFRSKRRRGSSTSSSARILSSQSNASIRCASNKTNNGAKSMAMVKFQCKSCQMSSGVDSVLCPDSEDHKCSCHSIDLNKGFCINNSPTRTKSNLRPSLSSLTELSLEAPNTANTDAPSSPISATKQIPRRSSTASPSEGQCTPRSHDQVLPLDTTRPSPSPKREKADNSMTPPVTPTAVRDVQLSANIFGTPEKSNNSPDFDTNLCSKFGRVKPVGKGEFSIVYRVTGMSQSFLSKPQSKTPSRRFSQGPTEDKVYAVKKIKDAYRGRKDRNIKLYEAHILRALSHAKHVVHYINHWENNFHLYIQTEYCEEGTLEKFMHLVRGKGRLDDLRIFKILQDLSLGLKEIHDAGFMHLDMKPANVLITVDGALKISDFGLARACSASSGVDIEGDRRYMAPEMLNGQADQPADVFSLGLITLEIATNAALPENGPTWTALRSGDISKLSDLTHTPYNEVRRDGRGKRLQVVHRSEFLAAEPGIGIHTETFKSSFLGQNPSFLVHTIRHSSLDALVRWMVAPKPGDRPLIDDLLGMDGLRWVAEHRNAPATVYECDST